MWNTKDRKKSWASEEKTTLSIAEKIKNYIQLLFRKMQVSETFKMAERKKPTNLEFWIRQNHPLRVGGNKDLLTQNLRVFVTTAPNLQEKLQDLQREGKLNRSELKST